MTSIYSAVSGTSSAGTQTATQPKSTLGQMDANDFLRLLTVQMKQQDPTDPVDQKDMLAQMAQFSTLSSSAEMNSTLKAIAIKLGAIDAPATSGTTETSTDGVTA